MTGPVALALLRDRHGGAPDLQPVDPAASAAVAATLLDRAAMLVVPDAREFPFDALREQDRDIPLVVGLPAHADATDVETELGRELLDHLTPLDTIVGPTTTTQQLLASRYLPSGSHAQSEDAEACAVTRQQDLARQWSQHGSPSHASDQYDLDWVPDPVDLRAIKARLRLDQRVLRDALQGVGLHRPPVRRRAGIVATRPETVAPALAGTSTTWHGVALGPAPDLPEDLDVVLLVGDVLHHPYEQVQEMFAACLATLRTDGWLLALGATVPDPRLDPADRPVPLGARAVAEIAQHRGRLVDVRGVRRPGEDHHRAGLFVVAAGSDG